MSRVKICGVNDPVSFDTVVAERADWLGFVFFPASPRAVTPAQAAALSARAEGGPARTGLFVDPSDGDVARVLEVVKLEVLQVYAPPHRVAELRVCFGLPVWRAVGVSTVEDLPDVSGHADALLIDAKPPKDATRPGGNGVPFDWSLLAGWQAPCPWLLAGGLTPENVAEAIRASGAPGVDVSSGVESAPGVKDPDLIRAFIRAARAA